MWFYLLPPDIAKNEGKNDEGKQGASDRRSNGLMADRSFPSWDG